MKCSEEYGKNRRIEGLAVYDHTLGLKIKIVHQDLQNLLISPEF